MASGLLQRRNAAFGAGAPSFYQDQAHVFESRG